MYQAELIWNREFHFVPYGPMQKNLPEAIAYAKHLEEMGDGDRVKETRIVNDEGVVVWAYGRMVKMTATRMYEVVDGTHCKESGWKAPMNKQAVAQELVKIAKLLESGQAGIEVANQGDPIILDLLNRAYADEWLAYGQYWIGEKLVVGKMRMNVEKEFAQHYADELDHAGKLADRIIELGGTPLFGPADWLKNCDCPFANPADVSARALIQQNIDGERCAINGYKKLLDIAKAQGDDVTEELVRGILIDEVEHENDLEMLMDDMNKD